MPTIAFIVSDGRTQDYPADSVQSAKMRSLGIDVWAYGTGEFVAIEELVNLTNDANKVVTRTNYHHLTELFSPYKSVEVCEKAPGQFFLHFLTFTFKPSHFFSLHSRQR